MLKGHLGFLFECLNTHFVNFHCLNVNLCCHLEAYLIYHDFNLFHYEFHVSCLKSLYLHFAHLFSNFIHLYYLRTYFSQMMVFSQQSF